MGYFQTKINADLNRTLRKRAGAWLKGLREEAGYTQQALSEKLGYAYYTMISQVETGTLRIPSEGLVAWAEALGQDPSEFALELLSYYDPFWHAAITEGGYPDERRLLAQRPRAAKKARKASGRATRA